MIVGFGLRQIHTRIAKCESFSVYGTPQSMGSYTEKAWCCMWHSGRVSNAFTTWSSVTADATVYVSAPSQGTCCRHSKF